MATYTLPGLRIDLVNNNATALADATFDAVLPLSENAITYAVPGAALTEVGLSGLRLPAASLAGTYGARIGGLPAGALADDTYLGFLDWDNGNARSILLVYRDVTSPGTESVYLFAIGGDALPDINTQLELGLFESTITGSGVAGGAFAPGAAISLAAAPGATFAEADLIFGTAAAETFLTGAGNDNIFAGSGNDRVEGGAGNDQIRGEAGDDRLFGGAGADVISSADGNDIAEGGAGNDNLGGGNGNDILRGGAGLDILGGGPGNDQLFGGDDRDLMSGGAGNDLVRGEGGDDILAGSFGDDVVEGNAGNDQLGGGDGRDRMNGGLGRDTLGGGGGADFMRGGADADFLGGGAGNDTMYGDVGNDRLNGGAGNDVMRGGAGIDTFLFNDYRAGEVDTVFGFQADIDLVRLANVPGGFSSLDFTDIRIDGGNATEFTLAGHTIRLGGVVESLLDADDFLFV